MNHNTYSKALAVAVFLIVLGLLGTAEGNPKQDSQANISNNEHNQAVQSVNVQQPGQDSARAFSVWRKSEMPKPWTSIMPDETIVQSRERERGSALDSSGGPDNSGYWFGDNQVPDTATYSWIELRGAAGVTWINNFTDPDEGWADHIPIGFSFVFYDSVYDEVAITTNGTIQFTNTHTTWNNSCLPVPWFEDAILAYWDDLDLTTGGNPSGTNVVGVKNFGSYTVIEFDSIGLYNSGSPSALKFEVILWPDGRIKMQYSQMILGSHVGEATVGIQGIGDGQSLEYVCNGNGSAVVGGRAIWYYRPGLLAHNFRAEIPTNPHCLAMPGRPNAVRAVFRNVGSTFESCPVKYRFDNGTIRTESTGGLIPFQAEEYQFATPFTGPMTQGSYELKIWCDHAADGDRSDDTIRITLDIPNCSFFECAEVDTDGYWDIDCNGGCNNAGDPLYQDIECGETVCGVGFTYPGYGRDTDWYRFTITEPTSVAITAVAEFPLQLLVLTGDCPPEVLGLKRSDNSCVQTVLNVDCLLPGDYAVWAGPNIFYDLDLSDSLHYWLTLSCRPSAFGSPPNDDCQNAGTPQHLPAVFTGNNSCSTHDCDIISYGSGETWHAFVLDEPSDVAVDYCETSDDWFGILGVVFTGCPCSTYVEYSGAESCDNGNPRLIFSHLPAGTYYLPVLCDNYYGASGPYTIRVSEIEPCDMADFTVTAPGSWAGNTCGLGDDCWQGEGEEVIYAVTIPYEGNWTFSMCNGVEDFYSQLVLSTECCGGMILAQDAGGCEGYSYGRSRIAGVRLDTGEYFLTIGAYWFTMCGAYTLDVTSEAPCEPDFQVDAPGHWSGNTCSLADRCWRAPSQDVTYEVNIPYAARWMFSLCGAETQYRTHIFLTTECCGGDLIAENLYGCGGYGSPSVIPRQQLEAGTYYLTIEGVYVNDCGPYGLDIAEWVPCAVYQEGDMVECYEADTPDHWRTDCNGGCGDPRYPGPYTYQDMSCGQSVVGIVFTSDNYYTRDNDMYRFTLADMETIRVSVIAEFPVAIAIDRIDTCDYAPPFAYGTEHRLCTELSIVTPGAMTPGDYMFWVVPMTYDGIPLSDSARYRATLLCSPVSVDPSESSLVTDYALYQNSPNPFNPTTRIPFDLPKSGLVKLEVYNILGQRAAVLANEIMTPGRHQITFDASDLPSGIYFYRLESNGFSDRKKMLLIK